MPPGSSRPWIVLLFVLAAACGGPATPPARFTPSLELVRENNRGVGLMGKFDYEAARQIFDALARQHPDWADVQVNLAIATLNRQREGDEAAARALLERVLAQHPDHLRARYGLALLLLHGGAPGDALPHFRRVAEADPADAYAAYYTGQCLLQQGAHQDAVEWYRRAIAAEPALRSAYYGAFQAWQRLGRTGEARRMLDEFERLERSPQARLAEFKYTRMGPRSEAAVVDAPEPQPAPAPAGSPFIEPPAPLPIDGLDGGVTWRRPDGRRVSLTAADIDGDGAVDLFAPGIVSGGGASNAVLLNRGGERFALETAHPLAAIEGVNAALWGDYDNDGLTDVYLCRRGPNQLWRQEARGRWADVTRGTRTAGGSRDTVDGALVDADHDGDLDLFLVNADGPNELLNNNRDGTFTRLAGPRGPLARRGSASRAVLFVDLDRDRDADAIVINEQPPHEVYANDRVWTYRPAFGFDELVAASIEAAVAGDVDADGYVELYTAGEGILRHWTPGSDGRWKPAELRRRSGLPGADARLALADIDGDGRQELLASADGGFQVVRLAGDGEPAGAGFAAHAPTLAAWAAVTFDAGAGPSVVGVPAGAAPVVWAPGPGRHRFLALAFTGRDRQSDQLRSNTSGIGTLAAVRTGTRWSVVSTLGADSGPGQSLQPTSVGVGAAGQADFVAITWSDGVFQSEVALDAGRLHRIEETQRQLSSCPVLFAFDGRRYAFVTDLLGVGGIGFFVRPGEYAEPDPTENLLLPRGLPAPLDGRYALKIAEPMEEAAYVDFAELVAYDLPPGWQMALDERKGLARPLPTGAAWFFRREIVPARAVNDRGDEVTDAIAAADLRAAPPGRLDPRFIGRGDEHTLTLTFARPLDAEAGRPVLLADGWIEYPYAQTVFAAWQAGADYRAPTLEARTGSGPWMAVLREFGYPAGMPRQMTVPLDGLPRGTTELRLRTNQEIYWDRLAVAYVEPCPDCRSQRLALRSAAVARTGFARRETGPQRQPRYDYSSRAPHWDTRHQRGFYTAFGPATELVAAADAAVAIIGPGEEIHLEFPAPATEPPDGWTRRLVLQTVGWSKDMDLYTRTGETIAPLPARGTPAARRDDLHRRYNTRFESGR